MVTLPNEEGVLLIGGVKSVKNVKNVKNMKRSKKGTNVVGVSNHLIKLTGKSMKTLKWSILHSSLSYERQNPLAFSIPEDLIDCKTNYFALIGLTVFGSVGLVSVSCVIWIFVFKEKCKKNPVDENEMKIFM